MSNIKRILKGITPTVAWKFAQRNKAFISLLHDQVVQTSRFIRNCAGPWAEVDQERLRSNIVFYIHRVEKGLSHTNFRPNFGKSALSKLSSLLEIWVKSGYSTQALTYRAALSVLNAYMQKHKSLGVPVPEFFNQLFGDRINGFPDTTIAGVKIVSSKEKQNNKSRSFEELFNGRSSVRNFSDMPVSPNEVEQCIKIAMKTPSVCNRQSYKVTVITSPNMISDALKIQGGWRGYPTPPMLLLVTVDIRGFVSIEENNEPYIDGGLFSMALLMSLEYNSLAACPLNTMFRSKKELAIKKLLGIPESETLIVFIAVGHFAQTVLVPRSFRYQATSIVRYIN